MTFLLLILLAGVAVIVTLVGYLLSGPPHAPLDKRSRAKSSSEVYSLRASRRIARLDLETSRPRYIPVARERSAAYLQQGGSWSEFWQAMFTSSFTPSRSFRQTPWLGITFILVTLFLLGIFLLHTLLPNASLIGTVVWPYSASQSQPRKPAPLPVYTASQSLSRISQLDPLQYSSSSQWNTWAYSACSTASMTEVINAYGHQYHIADILKVEASIGEITPQLGLLEDAGIANTVSHFGFKTSWGHSLSLDQIIATANHGRPVIVSFPPYLYDGGHLLVVVGGNSQSVHLADSSLYNRQYLDRAQFLKWWGGFSAIVTPA